MCVKKCSVFFKWCIVYFEVDFGWRLEEISFQRQGEFFYLIFLILGVSFSDFRGFFCDFVLIGNIFSMFEYLVFFCKCVWVCECFFDFVILFLQIFSCKCGLDECCDVIVCKFDLILRDGWFWGFIWECEVYDGDICVCSVEFVNMFFWFGWEYYFRKYLKLVIWIGSKESVVILMFVVQFQNF